MLDDRFYLINLYDFYKGLLTPKQREYFELSYFDDLSLSEIAEQFNVSRSAIHDAIQKINKELINYESILNLKNKSDKRKILINEIQDDSLKHAFLELEENN